MALRGGVFCSVLSLIHELLFNLFFHSVLDSVVIVALYFLYQVVILLLSWCCVLLSSSFVVY